VGGGRETEGRGKTQGEDQNRPAGTRKKKPNNGNNLQDFANKGCQIGGSHFGDADGRPGGGENVNKPNKFLKGGHPTSSLPRGGSKKVQTT